MSVYDAMDERAERLGAVRNAMAEIAALDGQIRPAFQMDPTFTAVLTEVHDAHAQLARAEQRLVALPANAKQEAPDLLASRDTFRLHVLDRPSIAPHIRVQAPEPQEVTQQPLPALPKPKTFEELDAAIEELKRRAQASKKEISERVAARMPQDAPAAPDEASAARGSRRRSRRRRARPISSARAPGTTSRRSR